MPVSVLNHSRTILRRGMRRARALKRISTVTDRNNPSIETILYICKCKACVPVSKSFAIIDQLGHEYPPPGGSLCIKPYSKLSGSKTWKSSTSVKWKNRYRKEAEKHNELEHLKMPVKARVLKTIGRPHILKTGGVVVMITVMLHFEL